MGTVYRARDPRLQRDVVVGRRTLLERIGILVRHAGSDRVELRQHDGQHFLMVRDDDAAVVAKGSSSC